MTTANIPGRMVVSSKSKEKWKHGIMGREHKIIQQGAQCSFFFWPWPHKSKKKKKKDSILYWILISSTPNQLAQRIPESRIESKSGIFSQETGGEWNTRQFGSPSTGALCQLDDFLCPFGNFYFEWIRLLTWYIKDNYSKKHFQQRTVKALLR